MAQLRLHADSAVQQLSGALHNRQAQAQTLGKAICLHLVKLIKDRVDVLRGDADPGVGDHQSHKIALQGGMDLDHSLLGVANGVGDKIFQHLGQ